MVKNVQLQLVHCSAGDREILHYNNATSLLYKNDNCDGTTRNQIVNQSCANSSTACRLSQQHETHTVEKVCVLEIGVCGGGEGRTVGLPPTKEKKRLMEGKTVSENHVG